MPRITFDTPADWTTNPSIASLGGVMLRSNSPATSRMNFQVPDPIDTVRVVFGCFSAVAIGLYLDDSPTPHTTFTITATAALRRDTVSIPRGVHKVSLARISGGSAFIGEIEVDDSTFKKVRIHNAGRPSWKVTDYGAQTDAYSIFNRIAQLGAALLILPVSINDFGVTTEAAWNTAMQKFIDAQKPFGDILATIGQPRGATETEKLKFAGYWAALAAANGLMAPRDLSARTGWASVAVAVAAGFLDGTEQVHPVTPGYADMATFYRLIMLEP